MAVESIWLALLGLGVLAGIFSGIPVYLVISGVPLIIALLAGWNGAFDLTFLQAIPQRIYGIMDNPLLHAIPLFVLMGSLLERTGISERMLTTIGQAMGGTRTSLSLSVLIVSTLIAAMTGVIGATITMLALISLPVLLQCGVPKRTATGLICAAGTLGQIIPPSIVLIILGDQLSTIHMEVEHSRGNFSPDPVSVGDLFAGAIVPGLVLVGLYSVYIVLLFRFRSRDSERKRANIATSPGTISWRQLALALVPVLLIVGVLGSILTGIATPSEAAAIGVAGTLLIAGAKAGSFSPPNRIATLLSIASLVLLLMLKLAGSSPDIASTGTNLFLAGMATLMLLCGLAWASLLVHRSGFLLPAFGDTLSLTGIIFAIVMAASILSLVFRGFGGDLMIESIFADLPGGKWTLLLLSMVLIFALGFVLEFIEIVLIAVPVVGPLLLGAGFDPVWLGVMIALNLQTSFLTPPFGLALFYFRSVAPKSITTSDMYQAIIPFVLLQIAAMLLLTIFPAMATWLPGHLY
jgi:tripartite ATP-independent transporter DctM subunit